MKKTHNKLIIIILYLIFFIMPINVNCESIKKSEERVFKVGFYDYRPYYFVNKMGDKDGYYHELFELISNRAGIKYEYVSCNFSNAMEKLENGQIDILLGANYSSERAEKLAYTEHYIGTETFGMYTNMDINYGELEKLEGLRFAFLQNEANSKWVLNFLDSKNINIKPISVTSDKELVDLLESKEVDIITGTIENDEFDSYKKVYEFSTGPVYLVANKYDKDTIKKINNVLNEFSNQDPNPVETLKQKYFYNNEEYDNKSVIAIGFLTVIIIIIFTIIITKEVYPKIAKKNIQKLIKDRIKNNEYVLYYQPIVNPKNDSIVGYEALLRLIDPKEGVLSPFRFIKEIEDNDMLFDISLWILEKVICDYSIIKKDNYFVSENFYISINVSLKEIENEKFVIKVKELLQEYRIKEKSICLEIVEKVGINDLSKIQDSINTLREAGLMIAIDDFGVEYSNLSILQKFDFDVIKLDKYFMNDDFEPNIRKEVMKFLSNICILTNKSLVAEGVEEIYQRNMIRQIKNQNIYIQGYFYSKPLPIEELKKINFEQAN